MYKGNKYNFKPKHKSKYKGNPTKIIARSSWELKLMVKLDNHPDVIEWSSEGVIIPYKSPIDDRIHRYFMDFYVKFKNTKDEIVTMMIEVKPLAQTKPPVKRKNQQKKTFLREVMTWGVNDAKWKAAREFAKKKNWIFEIFTEKDLDVRF
ncbi:MAG: head completion protein [Hyphomicrobiales bacterium]|nr:MAG: head completion protein [Hyphomicrobiales bacterium]